MTEPNTIRRHNAKTLKKPKIDEKKFINDINPDTKESPKFPWENMDPDAPFDKSIKGSTVLIKFNEWELNTLRYLAKKDKRSMQSYINIMVRKHISSKLRKL